MRLLPFLYTFFFFFLLMWPFTSCRAQKDAEPTAPTEAYDPFVDTPVVSTIVIPVRITESELNKMIDAQLSGPLYEDYNYDDNGGDNLMMNLWKNGPVKVDVFSNVIKFKIPIKYWLKKRLLVGEAESEGELELSLKTEYSLNNDWTINTYTITEYHTWTKPPVLKTGLGDLGIEWIANLLINRSKSEIGPALDKAIKENLNLKKTVTDTWVSIQTPTKLSEEYQMWLKVTPEAISMTPFYSDGQAIIAKIGVQCITDVTFGPKPLFRKDRDLPNLDVVSSIENEDFQLRVITDLTYEEAERLANLSMKGTTMDAAGRQITVEGLHLYGNGEKLIVKTNLSGGFNGNIFFSGIPVFVKEKNQVEMSGFDYELQTRNFLHRTANWLFSGTIKKKMQESMIFPLDENIHNMRTMIQESLSRYEVAKGVVMRGTLGTITVEDTRLTKGSIRIVLFMDGKLNVDVDGL